MSKYIICRVKGKLKLASYSYWRSSDSFLVEFGTSCRTHRYTDSMDFEVIADLWYRSVKVLWMETCPEHNILTVKIKNTEDVLTIEDILKMRGFKKFFGHKNIKTIEISSWDKKYY